MESRESGTQSWANTYWICGKLTGKAKVLRDKKNRFFEEEEILLLTSLGSGSHGNKMSTFKKWFLTPGRVTVCLESCLEVIKLDWTSTCMTPAIQISYLVYKGGKEGPPLLVMETTAMSIFFIYQCVQGAPATSDSVNYLGIPSKESN